VAAGDGAALAGHRQPGLRHRRRQERKAALYSQRFTHIFTKVGEGTFGLQHWPREVSQTPEVSRAPGF
jgi:hypothetical protein